MLKDMYIQLEPPQEDEEVEPLQVVSEGDTTIKVDQADEEAKRVKDEEAKQLVDEQLNSIDQRPFSGESIESTKVDAKTKPKLGL